MEPRLAFSFFVYQEICTPSHPTFNLALGYKKHSIKDSTRKTQHSSLIRKSWIHPLDFPRMSNHISFSSKTNRQEWKYTLLNVVTSKQSTNLPYIHMHHHGLCNSPGNITKFHQPTYIRLPAQDLRSFYFT